MALTALEQYIPLQNGQAALIARQNLMNNLLGQVGYEVRENFIVFTEDITDEDGQDVNAVDLQLVVLDFDKYGDFDPLPLPADMAAQVVAEVVSLLMPTPQPDARVDNKNEEPPAKR